MIRKMTMLLISLAAFAGSAFATDLYESPGFGYLHQYHNVANSDGLPLDIYVGISGGASIYWNGDVYYGVYNGTGVPSVYTSQSGQIVLTINETLQQVYIRVGRGQRHVAHYTLVSGELTQ